MYVDSDTGRNDLTFVRVQVVNCFQITTHHVYYAVNRMLVIQILFINTDEVELLSVLDTTDHVKGFQHRKKKCRLFYCRVKATQLVSKFNFTILIHLKTSNRFTYRNYARERNLVLVFRFKEAYRGILEEPFRNL